MRIVVLFITRGNGVVSPLNMIMFCRDCAESIAYPSPPHATSTTAKL